MKIHIITFELVRLGRVRMKVCGKSCAIIGGEKGYYQASSEGQKSAIGQSSNLYIICMRGSN